MRKLIFAFVLIGIAFISLPQAEAAISETKSYKLFVRIPAVVGINVDVEPSVSVEEAKPDTDNEIKYEEYAVVRNNTTVILRTSVLK